MRKPLHNCLIIIFLFLSRHQSAQCIFAIFSSGTYDCVTNQCIGEYTLNGTPPYTYTIVNAINNATFFVGTSTTNIGTFTTVPVGTYSVFGTTGLAGCNFTTSFAVGSPITNANLTFINLQPACYGGNNGQATAVLANGSFTFTPPFTYSWSNGANMQSPTNFSAGVYTLTVNDNAGCSVTNTIQINQTPQLASNFVTTTTPCYGGTVNSVISTTGGTSPYSYTINGTALPGSTATALPAGNYTVLTKDAMGCTKIFTLQMNQPLQPVITFTVNQPTCPYSTNGSAVAGISNAPPNYTYTWSPFPSASATLNNLPAGVYSVSIRDASACVTKSVVNVVPLSNMIPAVNTQSENCSALDGAFTLNVNGGMAPYTYSTLTIGNSTSNVVTGLSSGSYTTIITDALSCKDTVKFYVGNLSTVSVSIVSSSSTQCYGQCSGSVQLSVQNAVQPVTYSASGTPTTNSNILTGLCPGLVNIKVIDAIGCPATTTINFPSPPVFSYSAPNPAPVCVGKTVTLQATASGGAGGYNYVWNPGNLNGQTVTFNASTTIQYSLNVYDQNGCTLPAFIITVSVNPPLSISLNTSNSGICPGTTAQISPTVAGGDGNYSYNWQPGGFTGSSVFVENITIPQYTLTVSDGCGSPLAVKIISINLFPKITPTFSVLLNAGCQPFCTQFFNTTPKSSNAIWNYGDRPFEQSGNVSSYCYETAGTFNVRITATDSNFCQTAQTYSNVVTVFQKPVAAFVTDPPVVTLDLASNVTLKNTSRYADSFSWYQGANNLGASQNLQYSFSDTGCVFFRLIARNQNNCIDTLDQGVCVLEEFKFWIPNSFTPNGDGVNDTFFPKGVSWTDQKYLFEIYNRWGKRIFKSTDINAVWDGDTKGETDPFQRYFYRFRVTDVTGLEHEFKGFVLLLE